MNAIVAVDRNWAIGCRGQLLVSIPNDHKMFRQETLGKVILYGRKTLLTFPMGKPLDKRTNIVLSRDLSLSVPGATLVHSVEEAVEEAAKYRPEDVYVIGGESVYRQMLPYVDTVHVTKIDYGYEADAFFPNLDRDPGWDITAEGEEETYFDVPYTFVKYERVRHNP